MKIKNLLILANLSLVQIHSWGQSYFEFQASITNDLLTVPTNVLATVVNLQAGNYVSSMYAGDTNLYDVAYFDSTARFATVPVLGPATLVFDTNFNSARALIKFEPVNVVPVGTYAVQPNAHQASVALQSSTDLVNWQATTNGTYLATNSAIFYRVALAVQ